MELFFEAGRTNTIRERTTGILSDLLSEVIERVRSKAGEDMLTVAEGLNVNRHNTLLHGIPLKDGVRDVCAAIKEHAASRKRKRTAGPSDSECSNHGSEEDLSSGGGVVNGHVVDESSALSSDMNDQFSHVSDELNAPSSSNSSEQVLQLVEKIVSESMCNQNHKVLSDNNQIKLQSDPPKLSHKTLNPPPKNSVRTSLRSAKSSVRTSSRRAKLDAKKITLKPREPVAPPPPAPITQPSHQKKQTDSKPKKKRKSTKGLHKTCDKQYIKLEDVILADVPLLLDGDSDGEHQELVTLIKSEFPANWSVGKPRAPSFRKKYFCSKCTVGEEL
ncbi:uncharacterized protein LOC134811274 isoform X1 [Bolinopsis microptera]|uniref:uncharacterized protein LOC134811274 isoform X1 n=1 Tax=Bolinopsis microptera TaxID=2820187 RepID=UPI00307AEA66